MEKNETLIEGTVYVRVGTHTSHCCAKHGCKYDGDTTGVCPVFDGVAEQEYACPYCEPSSALKAQVEALQEEIAWSEKLEARGIKIYEGSW